MTDELRPAEGGKLTDFRSLRDRTKKHAVWVVLLSGEKLTVVLPPSEAVALLDSLRATIAGGKNALAEITDDGQVRMVIRVAQIAAVGLEDP